MGRFTRLCVEVDITKPLLTMFKLSRKIQTIVYEGIHFVYFGCGVVGHHKEERLKNKLENPPETRPGVDKGKKMTVTGDGQNEKAHTRKDIHENQAEMDTFGPWMLA